MISIAKGLTKHTAILVVDKRERGIAMQALLQKMGIKVILSQSLYEALRFVAQEMPHLVITEALLSDGTAGAMFDRLAQHPILKRTPILVNVLKKSKEEISALGQRKFAGFFLGKVEPQQFVAKVTSILNGFSEVSPYFVSPESCKIAPEIAVSLEGNIVGRKGDFVVSRSTMELDEAASLVCAPRDKNLGPILVKMPSNLEDQDGIINLFPISRIVGKGRSWIDALPDISGAGAAKAQTKKSQVLFYDPKEDRFNQFSEVLTGYDIELVYAPTLVRAASLIQRDSDRPSCVYLHELLADSSSIEWKKVYNQLPAMKRPPVIIGTSSQNAKSTPTMRFIKKPFGLGVFVETLEATIEKPDVIAKEAEAAGYTGIQVRYQAPGRLIGLDETGGIVELKFPVKPGCKIDLEHGFLETLWEGQKTVATTAAGPVPGKPNTWQLRFEAVAAGTSKAKYWERVSKVIETYMAAATPESA
jgi:DNA-binding response OmpR family regulator